MTLDLTLRSASKEGVRARRTACPLLKRALRRVALCQRERGRRTLHGDSSTRTLRAEESTAPTVAANEDGRAEIVAHAAEWLKESDVPSAAVAYIKDGKVAWTAVYGEQSPGVPATGKTLYNIASLTKPITAETILRLASAGKLSLDESMAPFWLDPDIKDDPWSKLLTPRLCLSHQTGFANWRGMTGGVLKMRWEPGTQTGYSGEGYMYLGRFAEKKMEKPFDALAQEMVFDPIGMKETSYTVKEWYAGRLAVPTCRREKHR